MYTSYWRVRKLISLCNFFYSEKKKVNQSNVKYKLSMSKCENSGSNAKSWQLHLELQRKQKQKPQGRGILSESLPTGVSSRVPTPSRAVSTLSVWTHIYVLCVVDRYHNLTTESSATSPAGGTPTFLPNCHSQPPAMAHPPLNYTGTTL